MSEQRDLAEYLRGRTLVVVAIDQHEVIVQDQVSRAKYAITATSDHETTWLEFTPVAAVPA